MKRWRMGLQDSARRAFRMPDGVTWTAEVRSPGASNAMVVFLHPDGTGRRNRYAWWISHASEARDVTARLAAATVLGQLDDAALLKLWRRSMPVDSTIPRFEPG